MGRHAEGQLDRGKSGQVDPWRINEESRRRRLREDGRRPLEVNLAEGLGLSEFLSIFTGAAQSDGDPEG